MSKSVRKKLQSNATLPKGTKRPLKKQKSSKTNVSEQKPSEQNTIPAQPKPEKIDVEKAQEIIFQPNPGPQTEFLSASEQEVLYGGPLTLGTPVLTSEGYKSLQEVNIGHTVYTHKGKPTCVVDVPFEGEEESYEVSFQDGTKVVASAGHKWLVGTSDWTKTQEPLREKRTIELLDFNLSRGRKKYFVPLTEPVNFEHSSVPLDPYFVGCMIGDGCLTSRHNMTLTGIDTEIVDYFNLPKGYSPKKVKGSIQWKFTQGQYGGSKNKTSVIWDSFKNLGLAGTRSNTKFIPNLYLFNDVETRIALLQGLMDTDGTVRDKSSRRSAELKYTTISSKLRDDFIFLAESLGYKVTWQQDGSAYRIYLTASHICPFRLTRKVARWKKFSFNYSRKYITGIQYVGYKRVKCITVADESHTFLVSHCTVTKNSAGGGKSFAMVADPVRFMNNPETNMLLVRRTTEELRELISIAKKLYPKAIPGIKFMERDKTWVAPSGATLWMSYLDRDDDVTRYQGQAFNWIGFDELTQWPTPFAWNYMRSRLRTTTNSGLGLYQRATSNPGGAGHRWVKNAFIDQEVPGKAFWAKDFETGEILRWPSNSAFAQRKGIVGQPMFKRRFIPATLFDNPYLAEDGMYEANLLSLPEHQRRQLLEGDWDINEGAAFPEFNRKIHVIEPFDIPENWPRFRAADYGYSSYSGVLWFAVSPDEQLIVYRELYVSKVLATDLADMILEAEAAEKIRYGVLDSSLWHKRGDTGPSLAEQMIVKGCKWRPADRSSGSRVAGKNELHRRLQVDDFTGEPRMVFFSNCKNLISQLPSLPLDKNNPEDVDTKSEDHLYDALRYGIMTRPRGSLFDSGNSFTQNRYNPADPVMGY